MEELEMPKCEHRGFSRTIALLEFLTGHFHVVELFGGKQDDIKDYLEGLTGPIIGLFKERNSGMANAAIREAVTEVLFKPPDSFKTIRIQDRIIVFICYLARCCLKEKIDPKEILEMELMKKHAVGF